VLEDCAATLGAREGAVARELTKHFETVRRGPLMELARMFATEEVLRGEIVLLVGPPGAEDGEVGEAALDAKLRKALESNSVKDAASIVSGETGQPREQMPHLEQRSAKMRGRSIHWRRIQRSAGWGSGTRRSRSTTCSPFLKSEIRNACQSSPTV